MRNSIIRKLDHAEWQLLRDIRLRALSDSPEHIGGDIGEERSWGEEQWSSQLEKFDFVIAEVDGESAGGMNIEKLIGDFGATCWIGSCWIDPHYRGQGFLSEIFTHIDEKAEEEGWSVQGLGVWVDNFAAISIYEKLGFVKVGPEVPSTRTPDRHYQRMIRHSR